MLSPRNEESLHQIEGEWSRDECFYQLISIPEGISEAEKICLSFLNRVVSNTFSKIVQKENSVQQIRKLSSYAVNNFSKVMAFDSFLSKISFVPTPVPDTSLPDEPVDL